MWLARNFPGLALDVEDVWRRTPEQTLALQKAGVAILKPEGEERLSHTKAIMAAAGMRLG